MAHASGEKGQFSFFGEEISNATAERIVAIGEQIHEQQIPGIQSGDLLTLAEKSIQIYDSLSFPDSLRKRAAHTVSKLATHDARILEIVIKNAELYARMQHIDDAFPYSPNSFEVLAAISPSCVYAVSFLSRIEREDWGVAKWAALQALLVVDRLANKSEAGSQRTDALVPRGDRYGLEQSPESLVSERTNGCGCSIEVTSSDSENPIWSV